jgi:sulfur-carrier protein
MRIQLRYFASLREALGPGETMELPSATTAGAIRQALAARGGRYAELLAPGRAVRCAVNQVMADEAAPIDASAELAFFPPVTGG